VKIPQLVLFGQPILAEQQISLSCPGNAASPVLTGNSSSEGNLDKMANFSDGSVSTLHRRGLPECSSCEELQWNKDKHQKSEPSLETGHCKVFMDSEDVGRTLDLSLLGSYEELYRKLANMFGLRNSEKFSNVLYRDINGITKHIGEEPFRCDSFSFQLALVYFVLRFFYRVNAIVLKSDYCWFISCIAVTSSKQQGG
jgi:hypothetical protein